MHTSLTAVLAPLAPIALAVLGGCERASQPIAPIAQLHASVVDRRASDNAKPHFNLEVILRAPEGASGFGHVKFRQDNDDAERIDLGVWVRDLTPNTHYRLQRAVDTTVDGNCTSSAWLTLGEGAVAQDVVTDDRGSAKQDLFRVLTSPLGTAFDIHFRLITTTGVPVLSSECYQFFVR